MSTTTKFRVFQFFFKIENHVFTATKFVVVLIWSWLTIFDYILFISMILLFNDSCLMIDALKNMDKALMWCYDDYKFEAPRFDLGMAPAGCITFFHSLLNLTLLQKVSIQQRMTWSNS